MLKVKRVYDTPSPDDGYRILVDRLWPRGLTKEKAVVDLWLKDIAPSTELRKWYGHDPDKWPEFLRRYHQELQGQDAALHELKQHCRQGSVTLLFSSHEREQNNAQALIQLLPTL